MTSLSTTTVMCPNLPMMQCGGTQRSRSAIPAVEEREGRGRWI